MKRTAVLAVILCAAAALAQSSPFLPQDLYRKLTNEFSGDIAYDHLRSLTQFHSPNGADRKSTRLNSSHIQKSRMPSSA